MVNFVDRVPTYPGRVRLTPVAGETNVYDLTREDDPIVVGTPLNAALFQAFAQVEIGSYIGAGSPSVDRTLTFSFKPDLVLIVKAANTYTKTCFGMAIYDSSYGIVGNQTSSTNGSGGFDVINAAWAANSLTFHTTTTYEYLDESGATYFYVAFGRGV